MSDVKSRLQRPSSFCGHIAAQAWFSYLTILLLQIKVTWGMWEFRDMTWGDTSQYFIGAARWHHSGTVAISWSPLYTTFYGFLLNFSGDAVLVSALHRWLIVIILAVLVLALMRRLLPHSMAWLMAAWWVVLPINFDALYEVHLFAVIPVMCATLLIFGKPARWHRAAALAMLLATTLLMRNEFMVATLLVAAFIAIGAFWDWRKASDRRYFNVKALSIYAVPILLVGLLTAYYYSHAIDRGSLGQVLWNKHVVNVCQAYAFGYQQRNSDFTKSAWTNCEDLMTRDYGMRHPTMMEALRRNPPAMLKHFIWNTTLIPSGLQVLLFGICFGTANPDYVPVKTSWVALPLTLIFSALLVAGLTEMYRKRRHWWDAWIRDRKWGWLLLIAVAVAALVVMITQRPRPSYIFSFGIFLRAVGGMCLFVLVEGRGWRKWLDQAFAGIVILMIVLMPRYYPGPYSKIPRLLARDYARLAPYGNLLRQPGTVIVSPIAGIQLCDYLGLGACRAPYYFDLRPEVDRGSSWRDVLNRQHATLIYADQSVLDDGSSDALVRESSGAGWQTVAFNNGEDGKWILMGKPGVAPGTGSSSGFIPAVRGGDIPVVGDWTGDGTAKVGIFRKGTWYLDLNGRRKTAEFTAVGWGEPDDIPVVGDWNGDGRSKIGVFRHGTWFLDLDGSHRLTGPKIISLGSPGDLPVVGDWSHKGKTEIGVFQSGAWLLNPAATDKASPVDRATSRSK